MFYICSFVKSLKILNYQYLNFITFYIYFTYLTKSTSDWNASTGMVTLFPLLMLLSSSKFTTWSVPEAPFDTCPSSLTPSFVLIHFALEQLSASSLDECLHFSFSFPLTLLTFSTNLGLSSFVFFFLFLALTMMSSSLDSLESLE